MNFAHSCVITRDPKGGMPRPLVDILLDKASALKEVLIKIRNAGYHPINFGLDGATPWIRVEPHRNFDKLVDEGVVCQYIWRDKEHVFQLQIDGVRVIWNKEGH